MQLKHHKMWSDSISGFDVDEVSLRFGCFGDGESGAAGESVGNVGMGPGGVGGVGVGHSGSNPGAPSTGQDAAPSLSFNVASMPNEVMSFGKRSIGFGHPGLAEAQTNTVGMAGPTGLDSFSSTVNGMLGKALGVSVNEAINSINPAQGSLADAMENANADPSTDGNLGSNSQNDADFGYDWDERPTILNPVPTAGAPVVLAPPQMPQYEFKRNWWEGNKFFPAPITRIS
jgi:hypothetical protein